jgi:hypothetical protein
MAASVFVAFVVWPASIGHGQSKILPELAAPGARGEPIEGVTSPAQQPSEVEASASLPEGAVLPTAVRTTARSKAKRPQFAAEDTVGSLHRMQVPFPDHNVIVCVGGCPRGKETIVFFKKRLEHFAMASQPALGALKSRSSPLIEVSSSGAPTAVEPPAPAEPPIQCAAGCYGGKKAFNGRRSIDIPETPAGVDEGTWLTGVSSPQASPPVMTRYSRSKGVRKDTSSEWFTKRF